MSNRTGDIIRPILNWTREEILEWLKEDGVEFRVDSSNAESKYTRNRIRHEVLPLLENIRKGTTGHLADWANRLRTQANAVDSSMSYASRDIVEYGDLESGEGALCKLDLHEMGNSIWGDLVLENLLIERGWPVGSREEAVILKMASVGAQISFGTDILIRERDHISLSIATSKPTIFNLERQTIKDISGLEFPNDPSKLWIGTEGIVEPLIWRPWKHGDKLSPTGMDGTVNVSDLLTQWKVPNGVRQSAHVLIDGEGQTLWVYIAFENSVLSRVSRKVKVNPSCSIEAFKAG
jgi:tRNA(Ile)-lysidine synthase